MYEPKPIETETVELPANIHEISEKLAKSTHDNWSLGRMREGWTYGKSRNDELKQHPGLVSYEELSEGEKDFDRVTTMETLKAIYALGYEIVKADHAK